MWVDRCVLAVSSRGGLCDLGWMVVGSWLIVIVVWVLLCELAWCGLLVGYPSSGVSFPSCHGIWMLLWWALARTEALRSRWVVAHGRVRVKIPFKRC